MTLAVWKTFKRFTLNGQTNIPLCTEISIPISGVWGTVLLYKILLYNNHCKILLYNSSIYNYVVQHLVDLTGPTIKPDNGREITPQGHEFQPNDGDTCIVKSSAMLTIYKLSWSKHTYKLTDTIHTHKCYSLRRGFAPFRQR